MSDAVVGLRQANSNAAPREKSGAGEGIRTLDINLGKVALYQLSYARIAMRFLTLRKRKSMVKGRFVLFPWIPLENKKTGMEDLPHAG